MTPLQKKVFLCLFSGGSVVAQGRSGYRVRDAGTSPITRVREKTFEKIKPLLKKTDKGVFIIDISAVRRLRKSTWIKKTYRSL